MNVLEPIKQNSPSPVLPLSDLEKCVAQYMGLEQLIARCSQNRAAERTHGSTDHDVRPQ